MERKAGCVNGPHDMSTTQQDLRGKSGCTKQDDGHQAVADKRLINGAPFFVAALAAAGDGGVVVNVVGGASRDDANANEGQHHAKHEQKPVGKRHGVEVLKIDQA